MHRNSWIDGQSHKVLCREIALIEFWDWLENAIVKDDYFNKNIGKQNVRQLFSGIKEVLSNPEYNEDFVEFIHKNFLHVEILKFPMPVQSCIRPTIQHQFILHLLISLGQNETEI